MVLKPTGIIVVTQRLAVLNLSWLSGPLSKFDNSANLCSYWQSLFADEPFAARS